MGESAGERDTDLEAVLAKTLAFGRRFSWTDSPGAQEMRLTPIA